MSLNFIINGISYPYPQTGEENWGDIATNWAQAVSNGMLQKSGGLFTLTAEVDFGANFGVKTLYLKSRTANVASSGQIRLANGDVISFRNSGNSANLNFGPGSTDAVPQYNSIDLINLSTAQTLTNKVQGSNLLPSAHNTLDIGSNAVRWKDGYFQGNLNVVGTLAAGNVTFNDLTTTGNTAIGNADTDTLSITAELISSIVPDVTNTYPLGSTSKRWSNVFSTLLDISGTATINTLSVSGTSTLNDLTANGNIILGNADTDTLSVVADLISNINPDVTNTYDLGTSAKRWRDIYVSRDAYLSRGLFGNGTVSAPSLSFESDTGLGIYRDSGSSMMHVAGGAAKMQVTLTQITPLVPVRGAAGTVSEPTFSFNADSNTGFFNPSADTLSFVTSGTPRLVLNNTHVEVQNSLLRLPAGTAATPVLHFVADNDTGIYSVSDGVLGIASNGLSAAQISLILARFLGPVGAIDGNSAAPGYAFSSDVSSGLWYTAGSVKASVASNLVLSMESTQITPRVSVRPVAAAGSAALPHFSFDSDTNTGMYNVTADQLGFSTGGVSRLIIHDDRVAPSVQIRQIDGSAAAPSYSFANDATTGWYRTAGVSLIASVSGSATLAINATNLNTTVPIFFPDATAGSPSITFANETNSGFYRASGAAIGWAVSGVQRGQFTAALTQSLVPFGANDGSAAAPTYTFTNASTNGFYNAAASQVGISILGNFRGAFRSDGFYYNLPFYSDAGSASTAAYTFISDTNTGMYQVGADDLGLTVGGVNHLRVTTTGVIIGDSTFADTNTINGDMQWQSSSAVLTQESLKAVTLADNTTADILTLAHASNRNIVVEYSVARGSNYETGTILVVHDGSTAQVAANSITMGTTGVTFSADISGASLRLRYTTSSTGASASFKYNLRRWNS